MLLGAVAEQAAAEGIETLTAIVLPENHAMIEVFRDSGFPVVRPASPASSRSSSAPRSARRRSAGSGSASASGRWRRSSTSWRPASIAVIGASARPGSVGAALVANLRESFDGPLHLVGRGQSVLDVAGPVELAVVAVPAAAVEAVARECAAKGVQALLVLSAGFEDADGRRAPRARSPRSAAPPACG